MMDQVTSHPVVVQFGPCDDDFRNFMMIWRAFDPSDSEIELWDVSIFIHRGTGLFEQAVNAVGCTRDRVMAIIEDQPGLQNFELR